MIVQHWRLRLHPAAERMKMMPNEFLVSHVGHHAPGFASQCTRSSRLKRVHTSMEQRWRKHARMNQVWITCGQNGVQAKATVKDRSSVKEQTKEDKKAKAQRWPLWWVLPLQPGSERITKRYEIVPNRIYTFEQLQGTLDVIVNIRMTVVVLDEGGLFVHAPLAPTVELIDLMRELEAQFGQVKYIVLPTTAVEHKIYVGPFAKYFPSSKVYVAPRQWSFPLNLPIGFLGLFPRRAEVLKGNKDEPWMNEFDYEILNLTVGIGPFVEVTFYHKATRTLLVTDSLFYIPDEPPEVCTVDPSPLLFRAKDRNKDQIADTPENRRIGWWKTIMFALFFQPASVEFDITEGPAFLVWKDNEWIEAVQSIQNKLLVAPILQVLIFSRGPDKVIEWITAMCRWNFQRIIPAHFSAPIKAAPRDLKQAFGYLIKEQSKGDAWYKMFSALQKQERDYPEDQLKLLRFLNDFLSKSGIASMPPDST